VKLAKADADRVELRSAGKLAQDGRSRTIRPSFRRLTTFIDGLGFLPGWV